MLVGTREALQDAWDILVAEGGCRCLVFSREKSSVFCPEHDPEDEDPLERGITRADNRGSKLLGAPVGVEEYEEEILEERLVGMQTVLDSLHLLEDPHLEYTLLRSCFAFPKFSYSMRTTDTSRHLHILEQFDASVRAALEAILGAPLTADQ